MQRAENQDIRMYMMYSFEDVRIMLILSLCLSGIEPIKYERSIFQFLFVCPFLSNTLIHTHISPQPKQHPYNKYPSIQQIQQFNLTTHPPIPIPIPIYQYIYIHIHIYNIITTHNKMLTQQDIQLLLSKLQQYNARDRPVMNLQQLPTTNVQDMVSFINQKIQRQTYLLDQLITQSISFIKMLAQINRQLNIKMDQINTMIEGKNIQIEELKENISGMEKQKVMLLLADKLLQDEVTSLRASYNDMHESFTKESELYQKKLQDEQNITQITKQAVQKIHKQNRNMNQQIILTIQQKIQLQQKVSDLTQKVRQKDQQLIKSTRKLDWQYKKKQQLQESIKNKQDIIKQLTDQIQELKETLKNPFGQLSANMELFLPPDMSEDEVGFQEEMEVSKVTLSQDVENRPLESKISIHQRKQGDKEREKDTKEKEKDGDADKDKDKDQDREYNYKINNIEEIKKQSDTSAIKTQSKIVKSMSRTNSMAPVPDGSIERSVSKTPSKYSTTSKKILNLDPYYCHYVLLSQTVKLTQNQQSFFNIDIKPYYKQIITQKIPMHEWREWLVDKFQQIAMEKQKNQQNIKPRKLHIQIPMQIQMQSKPKNK